VIKPNYPLLLLGNAEKQEELWEQLIEEIKQEVDAKDIGFKMSSAKID